MSVNAHEHMFHSTKIAQLVREAMTFLQRTPLYDLPPNSNFLGAGVYTLYYQGSHSSYQLERERGAPLYVGKAVPTGWRTGAESSVTEPKLKKRLSSHARSIKQASNLDLSDFKCRFMIMSGESSSLISVVESHLIREWRPVWNTTIFGFGNNDPGKGRYEQAKSDWDRLHPGRPWAENLGGE
ncbi:Eco29kI family restriction endonuclease [Hahella aquimaris]|uniref:Eco29kI family restriction endonuclease n=1 Tax=Hahella sp. HNIBRBA332 TaxID=3015983 RepID=UPI00273B67E0|nr:Eco29kI family restriction endonuclease [Hahella sp. HNIBRBA332]WLQ13310.1 Eco29kI family restriction endonuclease [Hahella sp. HNIBRBA332]